jgi:hypothetical protein
MDPALLEPSIVVTDGRRGSRRSECSLDCAHERKLYNACHAGQPPAPAGLTAADQARRCNVRVTANGSARWRWGGAFSVVRVGSIGKEHFAGVQQQEGAAPHTGDTVSACWRRAAQVGVNRPACSVVAGIPYCETVAASCDSAAPVARGGDRAIPNLLAHCGPGVHPSLTAIYPPTAICTHPPFCVDSLPSADLALLFLLLLLPALRSRAATAIVSPPSRHRASSAPNSSEPFSTAGVHAPAHTTATNSPAFTCTAPHRTRRGTHLPPSDRASH